MSESLKEMLTRLADESAPASLDPMIWRKARRSRNRTRLAASAATAAAILAAVGSAVLVMDGTSDTPYPADEPTSDGWPGLPPEVSDPVGNGGLPLERDLAVGRASVAIANDSAAFVITAEDGAYHRLALPGFDPALYDAGGTEVSGLTLSPDGSRLIYGWQGDPGDPTLSGARVVDLLSGEVRTLDRQTLYDEPARLLPWGFSWSPDSRLVMNRVKLAPDDDPWASSPHWDQGLDTTTGRAIALNERFAGRELRADDDLASTGRVASSGLVARWLPGELALWYLQRGRSVELPDDEVWVSGRYDASGSRLLMEPDRIAGSVLLLGDLGPGVVRGQGPTSPVLLRLADGPADVTVLGWVGDQQALVMLGEDLVLLTLDPADGRADGVVVGHVLINGDNSDFSFATDLVDALDPTTDFGPAPPSPSGEAPGGSANTPPSTGTDTWGWGAALGVGAAAALGGVLLYARRRHHAH
jgi:LPXTG-motif cell wall-anchored protein